MFRFLFAAFLLAAQLSFAQEEIYRVALDSIRRSPQLRKFRVELAEQYGRRTAHLLVFDSTIRLEPMEFFCEILARRYGRTRKCTEWAGQDKLKTFDSMRLAMKEYVPDYTFRPPLKTYRFRRHRLFVTFSDVFKDRLCARLWFSFPSRKNRRELGDVLFYFVLQGERVVNVYAIRNPGRY